MYHPLRKQLQRVCLIESLPDENLIEELKQKIRSGEKELSKLKRELDKLVNLALQGTLKKETIQEREQNLIEVKSHLEETLQANRNKLQSLPDIDAVKEKALEIRRQLLDQFSGEGRLNEMTYDDKRKLLHWLFDGKNDKGEPYGIYIAKKGRRKDMKIDYFLYGRITGLRTLKGDNINYQEDDNNIKPNNSIVTQL